MENYTTQGEVAANKGLKAKDIWVSSATILMSNDDNIETCSRLMRFLIHVYKEEGKYHEVFSGIPLEEVKNVSKSEIVLDVPYISDVSPLTGYLDVDDETIIGMGHLVDFIIKQNVKVRTNPIDLLRIFY